MPSSTRFRLLVLAAALSLAVGVSFAGPGQDHRASALTNCTVSNNSIDAEEQAFLTLINAYRAENGRAALKISTNLSRAATWHGNDMGTKSYFSHTDSANRSPSTRAQNCDYPGGAGENIAAGTAWDTAQEAFTAWKNSSGHNTNMLNASYKMIGIARVYVAGSPYRYYWVTPFGLVDDGTGGGGAAPTPTRTPTRTPTPRPSPSPSPTPSLTPSPTPSGTVPASGSMHIGDIDATKSTTGFATWSVNVVVTVHNQSHQPVPGATVTVSWSGAYSGSATGTTAANGTVTFTRGSLSRWSASGANITLTVTNASKSGSTFSSAGNHDPDGSSNGSAITVAR